LRAALFIALSLAGCGGRVPSPIAPSFGPVKLSQGVAYLGTSDACFKTMADNCRRAPNVGFDIGVSQDGNGSNFQARSSDPAVVTGSVSMLGPGGVGSPGIALDPHKAGMATLTISGSNGATALLPVIVTTVSTMTVTLNGFPSATDLTFSVMAPVSPACPGFSGGYMFDAPAPSQHSKSIILGNFPAMGNGPSSNCLFSTITVIVRDNSYVTLAQKTVHIPIVLGQDNPTSITVP